MTHKTTAPEVIAEHVHDLQQRLHTHISGEIIKLERKQIMPGSAMNEHGMWAALVIYNAIIH